MTPNPDVSVIIPHWNHWELLDGCLSALVERPQAHDGTVEVIVADNGSSDGSPENALEKYPWIRLARLPRNRGFAAACNAGAAISRGRHLAFLNNDARVTMATVWGLAALLDARPEFGAVSCVEFEHAGKTPRPLGAWNEPTLARSLALAFLEITRIAQLAGRLGLSEASRTPLGEASIERSVGQLSGALFVVSRTAWDRTGPMDEGYFLYLEETDYFKRLRGAGFQLLHTPRFSFIHQGSASTPPTVQRRRIQSRSLARYLSKHQGEWAGLVYRMVDATLLRWLYPASDAFVGLIRSLGRFKEVAPP